MKEFIRGSRGLSTVCLMVFLCMLGMQRAEACISEGPRHNNYLFSVYKMNEGRCYICETDQIWAKYVGSTDDFFSYEYNQEQIIKTAKKKGDSEMLGYIKWLNTYLEDNKILCGWNYPTRQQLDARNSHLRQMAAAAQKYRGSRLKSQYTLLQMRALFGLKQYKSASRVWLTKGRKLSDSPYKEIMRNLYAGCLFRTGNRSAAGEIYTQQQDWESLKFMVNKYRNLAGIKSMYEKNPNSATLTYLVQDFVNNVQETKDLFEDNLTPFGQTFADSDKVNWMKNIDHEVIYRQEANDFINFANQVLKEGRVQNPCLWQSAIGCIHYLFGDYQAADKELRNALSLAGTPRMKDNARAIRAVNSVHIGAIDDAYYKLMADNLRWLDSKTDGDSHYDDVIDRLVFNNLVPRLDQEDNKSLATALIGMQSMPSDCEEYKWVAYNSEYFDRLQQYTPQQLADYFKLLKGKSENALEAYVKGKMNWFDDDYYNDLISTKYLALGQFAEAIPYLEKVSKEFLATQNIAPYMAHKNWNVDRWFYKQKMKDSYFEEDEPMKENKKLTFCREMVQMESLYRNMREGMEKRQQAYKLASMYYQASYEGDCWWLTQYGQSVSQDSTLAGTKDFVAEAIRLLEPLSQSYSLMQAMAQQSNKKATKQFKKALKAKYGKNYESQWAQMDFEMREKSLYALAFIHRNPWYFEGYDAKTQQWYDMNNIRVLPQSRQYKALMNLQKFTDANANKVASYITKCDVLKQFRKVVGS